MHALQIPPDRLSAERHRPIDPCTDSSRSAFLDVAAETGRDLDRGFDVSAAQPLVEIGIVGDRRLLDEITRAPELAEIGATVGSLIPIEYGERQAVDIRRDAEPENQHEERGAEQRER